MIVELPALFQATKVAALTGGQHLSAKEPGRLSRKVDVGPDFEDHRGAVESVSVLFRLFGEDGTEVPSGWTISAAKFEVCWPGEPGIVRSHFGGRRFAFNWALGQVKANMDAKKEDPGHESIPWDLASLRKRWNEVKDKVAPWWAANSKEVYSSGIADLVQALANWKASKSGQRKGRKSSFPKFRSRRRDKNRVRFTTGAMRLEPDRRTITVPVIGPLRSKENTRRLERHLRSGRARILPLTLSERWGRLFVSVSYAVHTPVRRAPAKPDVRAGVDLGLRSLATVAGTDGEIHEFENPAALRVTLAERRRAGRQMSRRISGSRGHERAKAKLARLDRRAVHLRREAWHQLTCWLVSAYGEVVIEDLDIAAMKRSMGRRAFRRAVSDAALGQFRPMLTYKSERTGIRVIVGNRWYPSSQIHHGCGCRLSAAKKLARQLACQVTGELVDRDHNAAANLRDWPGHAGCGPVGATAPAVSSSAGGGGDAGSDTGRPGAGGGDVSPRALLSWPSPARPEPKPGHPGRGTLKRVPHRECAINTHSAATAYGLG